MSDRQKFVKRPSEFVIAVQLDLETDGFTYSKWAARSGKSAGTGSSTATGMCIPSTARHLRALTGKRVRARM